MRAEDDHAPRHEDWQADETTVMAEVETARRRVFTAWRAASRHARFFADDPGRAGDAHGERGDRPGA